jgi:hypothetical protein
MVSFRERVLTAALWFFLPAMLVLAVVGGVRGHSLVPHWDMWHGYLDFYYRVRDGEWAAWWALHNEHRIVLARLLFWIDLSWFRGTVWFLIAMNYALVLATCLTFRMFMRERAPQWVGSKPATLVALLVYGALFSWVQKDNLTWGFQSQFFLAQLVPLLALYHLQRATQTDPVAGRHFVLACLLGVASIATMANGLLALPIMCAYALLLRMGRVRLAILLALCAVCVWLYLRDYRQVVPRAAPSASLQHPAQLLQYVLLYLGSPFHHLLKLRPSGGAQVFGLLLIALTAAKAFQVLQRPGQHALEVALLAFIGYIIGTAVATGTGRLMLEGLQEATTSRYTTPAWMAWTALLVLYLPWLLQQLAAWRHRVVWPVLLLALVMLVAQWKATRSVRPLLFEKEIGALALALGIADRPQVLTMFYDPDEGVRLARRSQVEALSVFGQPPIQGVQHAIGQHRDIPAGTVCTARLTSVAVVAAETPYVRVRGWLAGPESARRKTAAAELLGRDGRVVGFVLTGPRPRKAPDQIDRRAIAFAGYVLGSEGAQPLRLLSTGGGCNTPVSAPAFRLTPDMSELTRSGADVRSVAANAGWTGADFAASVPPGTRVFGSYVQGDADLGSLTLRLRRGSAIAFRSGPVNARQQFAIDDGKRFSGGLPLAPEWTVLLFDNPDLPEHFTLTLWDKGNAWGEWSAVALREPGN